MISLLIQPEALKENKVTKWPHMLTVLTLLSLLAGVLSLPRLHAQEATQDTTTVSQMNHTLYLPLVARGTGNPIPAKPMISEFGAEPTNITAGETATLQWRVSGSASVRIEPDIGIVTGTSVTVSPQTTITYTLIATNAAGETRATTTVTVQDGTTPPPDIAGELIFSRSSTRSADIVVDEQGGIHAIAVRDNPRFDEDPLALIYAYCAPVHLDRCAERDAWDLVELAADSAFAQIALTPQGQPRILYEEGSGGGDLRLCCLR
jgi:hypothetical protein